MQKCKQLKQKEALIMTAYGYTLYKRFSKKKRRHVSYAQFRDARTGGRLSIVDPENWTTR